MGYFTRIKKNYLKLCNFYLDTDHLNLDQNGYQKFLNTIYSAVSDEHSQPAITCSKLTIETLEQGAFTANFEQIS